MKEPSVTIKMLVQPNVNAAITSDNIAGGVVVAPVGPIKPTLFTKPSDILAAFTTNKKLTRKCDETIAHAYAIAQVMPVYLCRAFVDDDTKMGKAIKLDGTVAGAVVKKAGTVLTESTPMTIDDPVALDSFVLQVGETVYYAGKAPAGLDASLTAKEIEVPNRGTALQSILTAINLDNKAYHLELKSESGSGDTYSASVMVYGLEGTTTPTTVAQVDGFGFTYTAKDNAENTKKVDGSQILMYIFANNPGNTDLTATITKSKLIEHFITLAVSGQMRDYEYEGSLDAEYINQYGINQSIENVNDYDGIEFEIVVGDNWDSEELGEEPITFSFGSRAVLAGDDANTRQAALDRMMDLDEIKCAFLCPLGYNNPGYISSLVAYGEEKYALVPVGIKTTKDDLEYIKAQMPSTKSDQLLLMTPHDRNSSLSDFAVDLTAEVGYLKKIESNKARGWEFAPVMGMDNGSIELSKPSVILSRKTREGLLDARVNSIIVDTKNGVNYLNKNKCTILSDDVLSEEQNRRIANKINRDVDDILKVYLGKFNTVSLRDEVKKKIETYFKDNISNLVYTIDSVEVICDGTNNTADVISGNKLVVDIKVRYNRAIYEVIVYHRATDLSA
jgi:hypothetical protein